MSEAMPNTAAPNMPQRRIRRLRIAASVFFCVVALLLCVLWVRSYWQVDRLSCVYRDHLALGVSSIGGALQWNIKTSQNVIVYDSNYSSQTLPPGYRHRPMFDWRSSRVGTSSLSLPLWLFVTFCVALAAAPWMWRANFRFSLRTMLIATTLVAVILGLVVWAGR